MVYIFIALYSEAKSLIQRMGLKREERAFGFDVFGNEKSGVHLIITGTGMIAAATATGSALAYYHVGKGDILINYGSCTYNGISDAHSPSVIKPEHCYGEDNGIGKIYICHKIIDRISGYTFYPDILYRHNFEEASIITEPEVLTGYDDDGYLHDMEASAIYQAGSYYLGPHQMSFVKVLSDFGENTKLSAHKLEKIMEKTVDAFEKYLEILLKNMEYFTEKVRQHKEEEKQVERLSEELHCSQTMKNEVRQYIRYWSLSGVDYQDKIQRMREQGELPCSDKREGKRRFVELKRGFI